MGKRAYLHLEDGESIEGLAFGYKGDSQGEVVFSTGMTGYPQSLTDPSFAGQILTFTYPLMGNFGVPKPQLLHPHLMANLESEQIWVKGVIVTSHSQNPSHFEAMMTMDEWLNKEKVPGIVGIDTRALTLKLREKGVMKGVISTAPKKVDWLSIKIPTTIKDVSIKSTQTYKPKGKSKKTILLLDCGVKHGIIRALLKRNYTVIRIPHNYDVSKLKFSWDGVVISNGPGDPKDWTEAIAVVKDLLTQNKPIIGVCLGHQLLALAVGADTYKLPYGHRGINQPCQDVKTEKAYITSQNHGYAVNTATLPREFREWFINLNDGTNEGMRHKTRKIMSTQFHPEGNPGPFDTEWIFDLFGEVA